jgi:hypothetical protein
MVLIHPTAVGPKKPPRLPMPLIQAMPGAAALPSIAHFRWPSRFPPAMRRAGFAVFASA